MSRALCLAIVALAAWLAQAQAQARVGFDHPLHARDVLTSSNTTIPCLRCHRVVRGALVGRPGHAACLGDCHGAMPDRAEGRALAAGAAAGRLDEPARARLAVCAACHATSELLSAKSAPAYPPYSLDLDWGLTLSHARHATAACARCHLAPGAPAALQARRPPHQRCAGCHDARALAAKTTFSMDACESCHFAAVGTGNAPALVRSRIVVTGAFSHASHAPRVAKAAGKAPCLPCHRQVLDERAPQEVPAPTAETCAGASCHDGAAAFPITERCTRCHVRPPEAPFVVQRPKKRYDHAQHVGLGARLGCADCHRLEPGGAGATIAEPGHAVCASCHAKDFGSPAPITCGACHTATEPWRPLHVDRLPAEDTAFGARLDHARHPQRCERCHALDTRSRQLRLPRDHTSCDGADCHRMAGGAAPTLDRCEDCHVAELVRRRQAERQRAPWSVRARFEHSTHRVAVDGKPAPCASCHLDVAGPIAALPTPPKRTCAPCHDGARAFALTGTGCARCHGTAK